MYSDYEPFRSFLRKQNLLSGLASVWQQMTKIGDADSSVRLQAPENFALDWELEIIAREIILNCDGGLASQNAEVATFDMAQAVNHLRRINEEISNKSIDTPEDAMGSMHALIHQQIPWQDDAPFERISRYAKILQYAPLARIVESAINISISDMYKIGLAVSGELQRKPYILSSNYAMTPGIAPGAEKAFFKLVATDIKTIRQKILSVQHYDSSWAYTYNPLRGNPLIYDASSPEKLFGISEKFLLWRITDGVYYDINDQEGFPKAWGEAFDTYIGEVLNAALPLPTFNIRKPTAYEISKGKIHHGCDWLISDATGHVFVECKTKRLTLGAKLNSKNLPLDADIKTLAKSFIQNYKNINEALNGLIPNFNAKGLPIFCVVITLENWRIELPELKERLDALIQQGVALENMPQSIVNDYPYMLLSTQQCEKYFQAVAQHSISAFFTSKVTMTRGRYRPLFPNVLAALMPDIAEAAGLGRFGPHRP
ncbi:MAG: hypothetical protein HOP24_06970 [Sideroxydans sp.]|nr:hypothetical protein [Sideroxydans sp.]